MSQRKTKTTILGAGSWGITIAIHCAKLGHEVILWEFDARAAKELNETRKRESVLKNITIPDSITITADLEKAVENADFIYIIVPSHVTRSVIKKVAQYQFNPDSIFVSCTKGIENDSQMRISEIFHAEMSKYKSAKFAVLSGPSHAEEVSREITTAVVVASEDEEIAKKVQESLTNNYFRIYTSTDVTGVELGGALKNVIAIAAGICDGAGYGDNSKAALQPRGLAEIIRLGRKLGADPHTFAGLSGMGDLIVTCMSKHSRNRYVGEEIGKGKSIDEITNGMTMVAEGVKTCRSAVALAAKYDVEMPICQQVYSILFEGKDPKVALIELMTREVKPEVWY